MAAILVTPTQSAQRFDFYDLYTVLILKFVQLWNVRKVRSLKLGPYIPQRNFSSRFSHRKFVNGNKARAGEFRMRKPHLVHGRNFKYTFLHWIFICK